MLVLSRHGDEAIIVDGHIRIMVVSICGDKVRLDPEAPPDMPVHREEVQRAIDRGEASNRRKEARP
jgi:carbon storage regulator